MTDVHNFNDCLEMSHTAEDLPFWEEVYRQAFPDMAYVKGVPVMVSHRQNGEHQKQGIDRSITLNNSKVILVDEKVRGKDYGDILLEFESNSRTRAPGWVCKPLRADFIAYAILPSGVCYLIPVLQMQNAWRSHGERWKQAHIEKHGRFIVARNCGYNTLSVSVTPRELFTAINGYSRIRFTPTTMPKAA